MLAETVQNDIKLVAGEFWRTEARTNTDQTIMYPTCTRVFPNERFYCYVGCTRRIGTILGLSGEMVAHPIYPSPCVCVGWGGVPLGTFDRHLHLS